MSRGAGANKFILTYKLTPKMPICCNLHLSLIMEVNALEGELNNYHLFHAIRGKFLLEMGQRRAQREAKAYAPPQRRAERRAKEVPDAASRDDQAVEYRRDMLLLHNVQDEQHTNCYGEVDIAGNQENRAHDLMLPQPGESLAHFYEQVVTLRPPFVLHGRAYEEQ